MIGYEVREGGTGRVLGRYDNETNARQNAADRYAYVVAVDNWLCICQHRRFDHHYTEGVCMANAAPENPTVFVFCGCESPRRQQGEQEADR